MSEREHALLSASSAYRWLNCPQSAVAAEAYKEEQSDFAAEGTLAHEVAEAIASGRVKPENVETNEDTGVTAEMVRHAAEYAGYIQQQIKSEDAVVLLEQRVDFSPWVPEGFGTCDCIIIQGDTLIIVDYKYGKGVPVSAVDNPQMKLYALGALNDYGIAYDVANVETHIYQPRIDNISADKLTAEELQAWGEKTVKPIALKAAKGKGGYKAGSWCNFCKHAGRCRTLTRVCTDYVEANAMRVAVPVLAPYQVAEVLQMEPLISLWLRRVKAQALTDLLDGKQIPGYKVVEGKLGNRAWTDSEAVAKALDAGGYSPEYYTETRLLSPAQMDKAIGKKNVEQLLTDFITRSPGAPTVVPESDKRPAYDRLAAAQDDFKE